MEGLRSFIEIDNRSAVDVGHLRRSIAGGSKNAESVHQC